MSAKSPSAAAVSPDDVELARLKAKLELLEAENQQLKAAQGKAVKSDVPDAPRSKWSGKIRAIVAFLIAFLGLLLVPIATVGAWAGAQLTETDKFVSTFGPIASDPAVQQFVIDEVNEAILGQVDIDATVRSVFSGLGQLDMPDQAAAALMLLEQPAVDGVKNLIYDGVSQVVRSPQFADVWVTTLEFSHETAIGVITGDPDLAVQLDEGGTLSLELGPLVEAVKAELSAQGLGFVNNLPQLDYAIELMQSDALVLVRAIYTLATVAGFWLPWLAFGLIALGVVVAKRRVRASMWAGVGLALVSAMILSGIGIGKWFVTMALSPSVMPLSASSALYEYIVTATTGTMTAMLILSIFIAFFAWFAGSSRPARFLRSWLNRASAELAAWGDRHGVSTSVVGRWLFKNQTWLVVLIVVAAAALIMFSRPLALSTVWAAVIWSLVLIILIQFLRRDPVAISEAQLAWADRLAKRSGADVVVVVESDSVPDAASADSVEIKA